MKEKSTLYKILTNSDSDLYRQCRNEIEVGKKDTSDSSQSIWSKVRVSDLYIDHCFNDINNTLHRVRGAVNLGGGDLDGPDAHSSISMTHEDITINLCKGKVKFNGTIDSSIGEPALFIECVNNSTSPETPKPLYLSELLREYNVIQVKK